MVVTSLYCWRRWRRRFHDWLTMILSFFQDEREERECICSCGRLSVKDKVEGLSLLNWLCIGMLPSLFLILSSSLWYFFSLFMPLSIGKEGYITLRDVVRQGERDKRSERDRVTTTDERCCAVCYTCGVSVCSWVNHAKNKRREGIASVSLCTLWFLSLETRERESVTRK